ncbi:type I-E CRISPR-associated protein Cas6/Cse3/CasE [bacterium]|nr:type I-E CRISPR-associated protein Cas6/Cse3/CasE [bacterium]
MFITRATFFPDRCENVKELRWVIGNDLYRQHQLLWKLFPNIAKSINSPGPFLFRRLESDVRYGHGIEYITVSKEAPMANGPQWELVTKPFNPKIEVGSYLDFQVQVNPIIARKLEGKTRSSKHDVVMNRMHEHKCQWKIENSGKKDSHYVGLPMNDIIREEGMKWLVARSLAKGFDVVPNNTVVGGYSQHILTREKDTIRLSTLDFHGQLIVKDPELFCKTLYEGLGPAKGLGCGLMLVKRSLC